MKFRSIFRHYWQFVRQYPWSHVGLFLSYGVGQISVVLVSPYVFKLIVDMVSNPGSDVSERLQFLFLVFVSLIVFNNVVFRIGDFLVSRTQSRIMQQLTDYTLTRLLMHSYTFFSNTFSGSLIAKSKRFVNAFETLHDTVFFQFLFHSITLVSAFSVLTYESTTLGAVFLVWFVLYVLLVRILIRFQVPKSLKNAHADTNTTAHFSDIVSNVLTVKMFGASEREKRSFAKTTAAQERIRYTSWLQDGVWSAMYQGGAIGVFNITLLGFTLHLWQTGAITVGTILLVQFYMVRLFDVVWNLSKNAIKFSTALADAAEMVELFDTESGVNDPDNPEPVRMRAGAIKFDNVHFTYEGALKVFTGLSLEIPAGEKVALVGHSGAGKTTITKILLRFQDIDSGTVTIDGQNISNVQQDELRKKIAYVPQEPLLFHRSLRDNIAYAKPNASLKEIETVAKKAHAHEFIKKLPNGYETLVGERGVKLSGGERQRVAIARAMLKDAPVIMLDEATSSLDSISEQKIQDALLKLIKGKTTIVIAHRLSTIQKMDRIIVFDKGRIKEEGTHQELLEKKGIYAELWNSQVGGFIAA